MKHIVLASLALAAASAIMPSANAASMSFSYSGGGITASGTFTYTASSTPGADIITGITGTYADTNDGISGAITGLYDPAAVAGFVPGDIAHSAAGMSYDDFYYPAGSPSVCPTYPFFGGDLDVYGLLFNVAGGYTAEVWSDGYLPGLGLIYGAGDADAAGVAYDPATVFPGSGQPVNFTATPEPGSLVLLASGLLALLMFRRKIFASAWLN